MSKKAYLIAPLVPLCLLLVLAIALSYGFNVSLDRNRAAALHARSVMQTTTQLLGAEQDAETGQRGYLVTGKPNYLEPYDRGIAAIPGLLQQLQALVAGDAAQRPRVVRLAELAQARADELQRVLDLNRDQGPDAAREQMRSDAGKDLMDQLRAATADILAAEEDAFAQRRDAVRDYTTYLFIGAIAATLVALLGQALASWRLLRSHQRLQQETLERGRAEAARRQSDALYRAYFENASENLFMLRVTPDSRCLIEEINPAYARAAGLQAGSVRDKSPDQVLDPGNARMLVERCLQCAASGEPTNYEETVGADGARRSWETVLVPVHGDSGRVERIVGSARDVSERKAAEEALRQSQKMEAIGHLTGGVAHDFNNLLQVVRSNLDLVAVDIADRERAAQRLRNAIAGADRAAILTRQLLAFARRQPLEPKVINLARVVSNVSQLLHHTLGERIEVETIVAGGLWNTLIDPTQVETSLVNLAVNARDAMPDGGKLTIEIANASLDDAYARQHAEVGAGQYVLLAVTDTGTGMSRETVAHAFEPFFTTKPDGKGTGLGLSMVYGFVKQSGGHLKIYSEPGHGTTVKIYLPRARGEEEVLEEPTAWTTAPAFETVLIVEDEAEVQAAAVETLVELGYTTLRASDARSALAVLDSGVKVDLLFTDVIMPGPMKAVELARIVADRFPSMAVLFTSGYTENAIIHHGRLDEGVNFLSKPYKKEELAWKVRAVLSARPKTVVLVVEDDMLVRMSAVDMLSELGFAVEEAHDGATALGRLRDARPIDVLLTDIGLPDIGGQELAGKARALRPGLKVIFATGYHRDAADPDDDTTAFLSKPYQTAELAHALQRVTATARANATASTAGA